MNKLIPAVIGLALIIGLLVIGGVSISIISWIFEMIDWRYVGFMLLVFSIIIAFNIRKH